MSPVFLIYLTLAFFVGILGRRSRLGFMRSFAFSVMITPIIMMLFLLMFATYEAEDQAK